MSYIIEEGQKAEVKAMKKTIASICVLGILLLSVNFCYAAWIGPAGHRGWHGPHAIGHRPVVPAYWHGPYHHYWGPRYNFSGALIIAPAPVYTTPYVSAPVHCDTHCYDRVVPVCRYDRWGDRWCYDRVVRDCSRHCY